jgi:pimeloyl-ACP methyl ester carboxylesterase
LVVFSHGFITDGVENAGMFMRAARAANAAGRHAVLVDHVGTGYSDGDYTDFRIMEGAANLSKVVDAAAKLLGQEEFVYWGHSLGTAIAALSASRYPAHSRMRGMILWHLSNDISQRYRRVFSDAINLGSSFCIPGKGYQVSWDLLTEVEDLDILQELQAVRRPILFLNGTADTIGDPAYAEAASNNAPPGSQRVLIE